MQVLKVVMKIFKQADNRWRWVGEYTNSLQDDDQPADILTSESHKKAIDRFENGIVPYPPLLLWHEPVWKIGETDDVFIDEIQDGLYFVIATGLIDRDKEYIIPYLDQFKTMSHGLVAIDYSVFVNRLSERREINDYVTVEISALPDGLSRPANPYTWFTTMEELMINTKKRENLEQIIPQEILTEIEDTNKEVANKALENNVEFKETAEEATTEQVVETEVVADEVVAEPDETVKEATPDVNNIALEVARILKESLVEQFAQEAGGLVAAKFNQVDAVLKDIQDQMAAVQAQLVQAETEMKAVKTVAVTPPASQPFYEHILKNLAKEEVEDNTEATEPEQAQPIDFVSQLFGGN